MIPPKGFDISPPDWEMLRRSRRVQIFLKNQIQYGVTKGLRMRSDFSFKADSSGNEKLIRKWTKSVFFGFFQS